MLHPDYTRNDPRHNNLALLILRKESAHTPVSLPGGAAGWLGRGAGRAGGGANLQLACGVDS